MKAVMLKSIVKELMAWREDTTPDDIATVCLDKATGNLDWEPGIYVEPHNVALFTVYGGPIKQYVDTSDGLEMAITCSLEKRGFF